MAGAISSEKANNMPVIGIDYSFRRRLLAFIPILAIYFFYDLNWMIDGNIRTSLINNMGFTLTQVSTIFGALELGTIPGTIIFGIIAMKTSKKRTLMLLGVCLAVFTWLPLINPSNLYVWIASRFACGLILGGFFGTSVALVVDLFPSKQRAIFASILYSSFAIGIQVSGLLYSYLGDSGWKILITICSIGPLFAVVLVYFLVPDDFDHMRKLKDAVSQQKKHSLCNSYYAMYKENMLIGFSVLLLSTCNLLAYAVFNNNALHYMNHSLNLSSSVAGSVFVTSGVGLFIGYYFWGTLAGLVGRKVGLVGFIIAGLSMLFYLQLDLTSPIYAFYICSFFVGFGFGCTSYWGVYYTELFPEKFRPIAAGISFNGGRLLTSAGIPLITSSSAGNVNYVLTWAICAIFLGAIIWLTLPETLKKKTTA